MAKVYRVIVKKDDGTIWKDSPFNSRDKAERVAKSASEMYGLYVAVLDGRGRALVEFPAVPDSYDPS